MSLLINEAYELIYNVSLLDLRCKLWSCGILCIIVFFLRMWTFLCFLGQLCDIWKWEQV